MKYIVIEKCIDCPHSYGVVFCSLPGHCRKASTWEELFNTCRLENLPTNIPLKASITIENNKNCWSCKYMGRSSDNALFWCFYGDDARDAPTIKELFTECELGDEKE